MFILSISKKEGRRSGKDRRKSSIHRDYGGRGKKGTGRRSISDRRDGTDRRKGRYFVLSEDKKPTIDKIIRILEKESQ